MNLVIVSGIPCSGKTTISKIVSRHFGYDILSKDSFKEELFLQYGFNSIDEKTKLDCMAEDMLYCEINRYVRLNKNLVLDKWLQGISIVKSFVDISQINLMFIRLVTESVKAVQRYNQRNKNGERPLCFIVKNQFPIRDRQTVMYEQEMTISMMNEKANRPFYNEDIKNLLEVDTSNIETELTSISKKVIDFIGERLI